MTVTIFDAWRYHVTVYRPETPTSEWQSMVSVLSALSQGTVNDFEACDISKSQGCPPAMGDGTKKQKMLLHPKNSFVLKDDEGRCVTVRPLLQAGKPKHASVIGYTFLTERAWCFGSTTRQEYRRSLLQFLSKAEKGQIPVAPKALKKHMGNVDHVEHLAIFLLKAVIVTVGAVVLACVVLVFSVGAAASVTGIALTMTLTGVGVIIAFGMFLAAHGILWPVAIAAGFALLCWWCT